MSRTSPFEERSRRLVVHTSGGDLAQPFSGVQELCSFLRGFAPLLRDATWLVEQ